MSYDNKPIYYSVETPTVGSYSFKGDKALSGNIDLVIHGGYPLKRICLIEFKAHNVVFKNDYEKLYNELNPIANDVDKVHFEERYDENACGYFVQLLTNSDSGTANSIIDKKKKYEEADKYKYKANKLFQHIENIELADKSYFKDKKQDIEKNFLEVVNMRRRLIGNLNIQNNYHKKILSLYK